MKLIRCRALLFVFAFAQCGCQRTASQSQSQSQSQSRSTLRFLTMQYSKQTRPYWESVCSAFEKENPDTHVDLEVVLWDQGQTRLRTLINAAHPPDIANIATTWLTEYADAKLLEPLDANLSGEFRDRFIPMTLQGATYQSKTYGLPIAVSVRALYYNKQLLAKAGKQPPTTWDELRDTARATSKGDVYGFAIPCDKEEGHAYFAYFTWGAGGDFLDRRGNLTIDSSQARRALDFLVTLARKDRCANPSPETTNRDRDAQEWFKQGKAAMLITGSWFWLMLDRSSKVDYGIAPIPVPSDRLSSRDSSATMAVTDNLVLFRACKNKSAALRFLNFIYGHKWRKEFDDREGMLPELKSVADSYRSNPKWRVFIDQFPHGRFLPNHPRSQQIFLEITKAQQRAYLGEVSPAKALADASKKINTDILKR